MKQNVLGIGNALLDYQIEVPFSFLDRLGVKKGSMTLVDLEVQERLIKELHKDFGHESLVMSSGGSAANTLAGLRNLGGTGFFLGKVAEDTHGTHYRHDLERIGIRSSLNESPKGNTGTCIALVTPDAERTMLTYLGIAVELSQEEVNAEDIYDSQILYIEGYLWDSLSARKACLKAMEIAKAKKIPVAFTYSDSFCVERHSNDFLSLAREKIDILFCNDQEALRATKAPNANEAFQQMKNWCDKVCITTGPHGALLSDRSKSWADSISTWDVKLVDKLGAGDLFASGVLFGLTHQLDLKASGYLGCYLATQVIQQMSARLDQNFGPEVPSIILGPRTTPRSPARAEL